MMTLENRIIGLLRLVNNNIKRSGVLFCVIIIEWHLAFWCLLGLPDDIKLNERLSLFCHHCNTSKMYV